MVASDNDLQREKDYDQAHSRRHAGYGTQGRKNYDESEDGEDGTKRTRAERVQKISDGYLITVRTLRSSVEGILKRFLWHDFLSAN